METLSLSAEYVGKVIAFEQVVAAAMADGRIRHEEGLRIIAAARAANNDGLPLAESVDFIGSVARGTRGLDSPRVQRRLNERRRRNVVDLYPDDPEPEPNDVRSAA